MGESQGGEEEKTPRGKKRKREGDPEVIKTITTFIDDKFKNVLKEAVLKDDSDLTDPIIQIGVKMYITDLLSLATGVCIERGPDTCGWRMRMGKCGQKNANEKKKTRITKKGRGKKREMRMAK